jgi:hypothetical protein
MTTPPLFLRRTQLHHSSRTSTQISLPLDPAQTSTPIAMTTLHRKWRPLALFSCFPIPRTAICMRNSEDLNRRGNFAEAQNERKPSELKLADSRSVRRPASWRPADQVDRAAYLLHKSRRHNFAAFQIPRERGHVLFAGCSVKLNLFVGGLQGGQKFVVALLPRGRSWLYRSLVPQRDWQSLVATCSRHPRP